MIKIKKLLLILLIVFLTFNLVVSNHHSKNKKNPPKNEIEENQEIIELKPIQEIENSFINERLNNNNNNQNNQNNQNNDEFKNKNKNKKKNKLKNLNEKEIEEKLKELKEKEKELIKKKQELKNKSTQENNNNDNNNNNNNNNNNEKLKFNSNKLKSRKFVEHKVKVPINEKVWKIMEIKNTVDAKIELTFGIKQRNLDELEEIVWQVSDPEHENYGKYKNFEEIKKLVKPLDESIHKVQGWLLENDILSSYVTDSGDFVRVVTTVKRAEQLLNVRYNKMVHKLSKKSFYRSLDPYTVPEDLLEHIDFIGGVNHLPILSSKPISPNDNEEQLKSKKIPINFNFENQFNLNQDKLDKDPYLSPSLIRREMNVSQISTNSSQLGNSQAIAQFLKEYFSPADLKNFQNRFGLPNQEVVNILGPNEKLSPGLETALDIQYIMAMAPNVPTWIVSTGGLHEGQEPFLDWLVDLSSNKDLPLVHSISYGDDESSIQKAYTDRVDTEFKKYAAMGRTIVFSSGDFGVGCNSECNQFAPGWPASSRFVLAVGGVVKKGDGSIIGDSISGGGFSNYFSRPKYQEDECLNYINSLNGSLSSYYSQSGRGYPDISSFSENVVILHKNRFLPIGGTSASAPIIAGLLSLINDRRLQIDKPSIGFFNPLLYKISREYPNSFFDIDVGENDYKCCSSGFKASKGWDPVTGLGVPNFDVLLENILSIV